MSYLALLQYKIQKEASKRPYSLCRSHEEEDDGTDVYNKILTDGDAFISALRSIKKKRGSKFIYSNAPIVFPALTNKKTVSLKDNSVIHTDDDYVYLCDGIYSLKEGRFMKIKMESAIPYQMKSIVRNDQIVRGGCLETEDTIYVSEDAEVEHSDLVYRNGTLQLRNESYPDSYRVIFWNGANRVIYRDSVKKGDKEYYVFTIEKMAAVDRDYNGRKLSYVVPAKRWGVYHYHDCFYFNDVFCINYMDSKGDSVDVDAATLRVFESHQGQYERYYSVGHAVFVQGEEMIVYSYGSC